MSASEVLIYFALSAVELSADYVEGKAAEKPLKA